MRRTRAAAAFTLLEVLVAIAILGLGLTTILSAQTGLFASSGRTARLSTAVGLLRCRMNEVELDLMKDGYPIVDESERGPCCDDESLEGFQCSWKIERIELPDPPTFDETAGEEGGDDPLSGGVDSMGPLGALAGLQQGGGGLEPGSDFGDVSELMSGAAAGGVGAVAPIVMNMVYPQLRPMLEASIRKVTVTVTWKDGSTERDLSATQFLTDPQQGGFDPTAAHGLDDQADAISNSLPGPSGPSSSSGSKSSGGSSIITDNARRNR